MILRRQRRCASLWFSGRAMIRNSLQWGCGTHFNSFWFSGGAAELYSLRFDAPAGTWLTSFCFRSTVHFASLCPAVPWGTLCFTEKLRRELTSPAACMYWSQSVPPQTTYSEVCRHFSACDSGFVFAWGLQNGERTLLGSGFVLASVALWASNLLSRSQPGCLFSCWFDKIIFGCNEIMPLHVWGARRWGVKEIIFLNELVCFRTCSLFECLVRWGVKELYLLYNSLL
jgi:hypothetical protein